MPQSALRPNYLFGHPIDSKRNITASNMEYSDISLSQLGVIRIKISFTLPEQKEN